MKQTRKGGSGSVHTTIHFDGSGAIMEQVLLLFGAPVALASVVGFILPKLFCVGCLWCCCFRGRRRGGQQQQQQQQQQGTRATPKQELGQGKLA